MRDVYRPKPKSIYMETVYPVLRQVPLATYITFLQNLSDLIS